LGAKRGRRRSEQTEHLWRKAVEKEPEYAAMSQVPKGQSFRKKAVPAKKKSA